MMNETTLPTSVTTRGDSLCAKDSCCHCVVTAPVEKETSSGTSSSCVVGAYVLAALALVIALGAAYLLGKMICRQKKAVAALRTQLQHSERRLAQVKTTPSPRAVPEQETAPTIVTKVEYAPTPTPKASAPQKENTPTPKAPVPQKENTPSAPARTIRYGTLRAPDEQGQLCFAERTMVATATGEKMFILELDLAKGEGIYRINPAALPIILGDLQTFQNFVKPFSFSGTTAGATITDKKVGHVVHRGDFWVVSELLEITIH